MQIRPIVRWTAGPPRSKFDDGILKRSILNFRFLYGDRFDYVLCLNGRDGVDFDSLGVEIFRQSPLAGAPEPKGVAWKLYPPRLRLESHEIFIDHDIVLVDRLLHIERFLDESDSFLYSQSFWSDGLYGSFRDKVPGGFGLNSGLFGLPPGFSFDLSSVKEWRDDLDEQGFVAAQISRQSGLIRVGLEDLWICADDRAPKDAKGYHFCRANRDESWPRFLSATSI
jgi:hypothetical protein